MLIRKYFYLIVSTLFIVGCNNANNEKELELKERELELKEKQLEQASKAEKPAPEITNQPNNSDNYSTSGSMNSSTYSQYGTITGNKVIIRKSYSTKSANKGSFRKGEQVLILDEYYPTNAREAISKSNIHLYNDYGSKVYTLVPGKALEVLSESYGVFEVRFVHPDYGNLTASVNANDLEFISGDKWYQVKRNNGQTGWVFSKFVRL